MSKQALLSLVLGLFVAADLLGAEPAQWSQFRGPNGSGVSQDDKRLPVNFGAEKNVVWKTALPPGHSSPCVWKDRLFLTAFEPSERKLETVCLDRVSGKILWRQQASAEKIEEVHPASSPAASTPATDGAAVYVYFGSYGLLSYDFDGQELWREPLHSPQAEFGSGTSPIVVGDLVILNNDHDAGAPLHVLHRKTGKPAWKQSPDIGAGYSSPIVWSHDGVQELILQSRNRLTSLNLDGTVRWTSGGAALFAITTPVVGDGLLFVNFSIAGGDEQDRKAEPFDKMLEKYDKNKDGLLDLDELPSDYVFIDRGVGLPGAPGGDITVQRAFGRIAGEDKRIDRQEWNRLLKPGGIFVNGLWAIRPGAKETLDDAAIVWRTTKSLPEVPSPLYYQGHLYLVRKGGLAICLEARTGNVVWQARLPDSGNYYASPVAGDGKLYIAAESGLLFVIQAGAKKLTILAKNDLGERILATPAITDGTLYVRTEKNLFAFRE